MKPLKRKELLRLKPDVHVQLALGSRLGLPYMGKDAAPFQRQLRSSCPLNQLSATMLA